MFLKSNTVSIGDNLIEHEKKMNKNSIDEMNKHKYIIYYSTYSSSKSGVRIFPS